MAIVISSNSIGQYLLDANVGMMVGKIKELQLILHVCLTESIVPPNAQTALSPIFSAITFDPIDVSDESDELYKIDQAKQKEMKDNFV